MCDLTLNGQAGGCLGSDNKTPVTIDINSQYSPAISGNYIAWIDYGGFFD